MSNPSQDRESQDAETLVWHVIDTVTRQLKVAEFYLDTPEVQNKRCGLAMVARGYLILLLFQGEQLLATLRDDGDYKQLWAFYQLTWAEVNRTTENVRTGKVGRTTDNDTQEDETC
jgi:hypothetical protein